MKHPLLLFAFFSVFALSVTVFLVSVVGLVRLRYGHDSRPRRRHRSRHSRLRAA